ncbi:MAG: hypothetical protein IT179_21910 [Acidobacteria bacterium]|nr:hypothetical protein [Acidobacteriota bacterium]
MSLRVAFDMDGTVADMYAVLRRVSDALFAPPGGSGAAVGAAESPGETSAIPGPSVDELHLTAAQQRRLWEHVKGIEDFWTTLPEASPGIIARLADTARRRRWEVLFITTRPPSAGDTTQAQTQRWLEAHGFRLPSVFVVPRSRGKLADALQLDAVVDDRPENCLDVAMDSKATPVLVWPSTSGAAPAAARHLGVRTVGSISEALAFLERLDDERRQPAVVRRIRRLLRRESRD